MTYSLKLDSFSGLCTILDGERVVAQEVGAIDAAKIVEAMAREDDRRKCIADAMLNGQPITAPGGKAMRGTL